MLLPYKLETGHEAQLYSRKAIDYNAGVIISTVFERMDGTQKQLHKGKWIQSVKGESRLKKVSKTYVSITNHLKWRMKIRKT